MASANSLNPDAPVYIPLCLMNASQMNTNHLQLILPIADPSSSMASGFPASPPFHYPNPPPTVHVPDQFSLALNQRDWKWEPTNYHLITFLPHHLSTNSFLLPPPPPPSVAPLVVKSEPAGSVVLPRVVIRERNDGRPNRQMMKAWREKGSEKGGFGFGVEGNSEGLKRSDSFMHEEKRGLSHRALTYAEKYRSVALRREEHQTTVMFKNIPYQYTPRMLVEFMDKHCKLENQRNALGSRGVAEKKPLSVSAYDFLYLPMDFRTKMNRGYAFVNFSEPEAAWKFFNAYDGTKWDFEESSKTRKVVRARIQGKEALVKHFQKSHFECESDEFLPLCFTPPRDGSGSPVQLTVVGNRGTKYRSFAR